MLKKILLFTIILICILAFTTCNAKKSTHKIIISVSPNANFLYTLNEICLPDKYPLFNPSFQKTFQKISSFDKKDEIYLDNFRNIFVALDVWIQSPDGTSASKENSEISLQDSLFSPSKINKWQEVMTAFFESNSYDEALNKTSLDNKTKKEMQEILQHFKPKFDKLWIQMKYLEDVKKKLEEAVPAESISAYIKKMEKYYGAHLPYDVIYIDLMWAPNDEFRAMPYKNHIVFSVPPKIVNDKDKLLFCYSIAAHELGHIIVSFVNKEQKKQWTDFVVESVGIFLGPLNVINEVSQVHIQQFFMKTYYPDYFKKFGRKDCWYYLEPNMEVPYAIDQLSKESFSVFEEYFSTRKTFNDFLPELMKIYQNVLPVSPKMLFRVCSLWNNDKHVLTDFKDIFNPTYYDNLSFDTRKNFDSTISSHPETNTLILISSDDFKKNNWLWEVVPLEEAYLKKKLSEGKGIFLLTPNKERGYKCWIIAPDQWGLRQGMIHLFELNNLPKEEVKIEFNVLS